MQINAATVMVTCEFLMANPASSALLKDFFDYIITAVLGPESMNQFSLAVYSISARRQPYLWRDLSTNILQFQTGHYGLFHDGPHSLSWKILGHNKSEGRFRMERHKNLIIDHYNDPAGVLIAIFENSLKTFVRTCPSVSYCSLC